MPATPGVPRDDSAPIPGLKSLALEWGVILLVVSGFCAPFLSFDPEQCLPGNEAEVFQTLDWILVNALARFGQFPQWNPYIQTGLPYVADPFLHVYHPLATLPVLVFGVWNGFKVALFLSYLAAALGMWWLGVVLRSGRLSRLWMALMYAFTGQAAARFFQGQYNFVLGYAWIPWSLAFALLALRTGRPLHAIGAAVSLSLLFFSGNAYYAFYMALSIALLAATALVGWDAAARRPRLRSDRLCVIALIGILSLGLTAVQFLPLVDFQSHYTKDVDPELTGSHSLPQIVGDFVSRDAIRPDLPPNSPREEHYAYTGIWPFLLLPFAAYAFRSGRRHDLVFLALLLLLSLAWVAVRYMPWASLVARVSFLNQFRFQTRMNIFAAVAFLGLAGCGLDVLWRTVSASTSRSRQDPHPTARMVVPWLAAALLLLFAAWSVGDVYRTNRTHVHTRGYYDPPYELAAWLRRNDGSTYYVSNQMNWHGALISNGIPLLDAWYGFNLTPLLRGAINRRAVHAGPRYVAVGNDSRPDQPGANLVKRFVEHSLYRVPGSLPYAFAVDAGVLADAAGGRELRSSEVRELPPRLASPNRIEIEAEGTSGEILTVLAAAFPGWSVTVNDRSAPLLNVGGYIAVALQPGRHTYVFGFSSSPFRIGLALSLLTLLALPVLACAERRSAFAKGWRITRDGVAEGEETAAAAARDVPKGSTVPEVGRGELFCPDAAAASDGGNRRSGHWPGWVLFGAAMLVYLFTRLYAVDRFPVYFFADEAIQAVYAQELLDRGFTDAAGKPFPLYFEAAGNRWTPLLSVYVHALPIAVLGKSVVVTRATSALVSALAAVAVALMLKLIFGSRIWWASALLMSVLPAWFLHSRTGFETVMMASFFACTLLCYLLYRTRSARYVFAAVLFGAATFYTYSNGQVVVAAFAAMTALSDIRYHLRHWRTLLPALLLAAILAVPAMRFRFDPHAPVTAHLRTIDSYWFQDVPLAQKAAQFARTYAYGLSPAYWFFANEHDLVRHRMKGYGHLNAWLLPFFAAGVGLCLWRIRSPAHRALLLAALAAPAGAALVDVSITRVLAFAGPAVVFACLGLDLALAWLEGRRRVSARLASGAAAAVLCAAGFWMLRDALLHGPLWHDDYGLYGMQYGATQLFAGAVPAILNADAHARICVTSTWANGAEVFIPFFLSKEHQARVQMLSVEYFMAERRPLDGNTLLVMTPAEYERARASGMFQAVDVDRVIPYPDGRPGFYFARLSYAKDFEQRVAAEKAARSLTIAETLRLGDQVLQVSHSAFDMGQMGDLFDGDTFTLVRGREANPLVLDFSFAHPRPVRGLRATFGSMDFILTARISSLDEKEAAVYSREFRGLPPDPTVEMEFTRGPTQASRLRLEVLKLDAGEEEHIHVRELTFR